MDHARNLQPDHLAAGFYTHEMMTVERLTVFMTLTLTLNNIYFNINEDKLQKIDNMISG